MVAASKILQPPIKYCHCSQLPLHCDKTCFRSFLNNFYKFTLSGFRYYSPLVLAPLLLKGNAVSIERLMDTVKFYLKTVFSSAVTGSVLFLLICLFRNGRGKFEIWTTFILPPFLAAQVCWFYSAHTLRLFYTSTTQVVLECLLRQNRNGFTNFLLNSTSIQTFIFMIASTVIMHFKRLRQYNGFWFIKPESRRTNKGESGREPLEKTQRNETIWKYLLRDSKTYLTYGIGLDLLNTILKKFGVCKSKGPVQFLWQTVKDVHFDMTYFFISYVGIYKMSLYYLNKYLDTPVASSDWPHAIASFLGGSSYAFLNKLTCNTFAIVLAVQILWQRFCRKTSKCKDESSSALETIKKIPFSQILFPINVCYMVYMYFHHHDCINSLGKNLLNAVSAHKIHEVFDYITKNDVDSIIRDSTLRPRMGVF